MVLINVFNIELFYQRESFFKRFQSRMVDQYVLYDRRMNSCNECRSGVTKGWVTSVCRVALGSQCLGKYNPKGEANFLGLFLSEASLSLAERRESIGRIRIALLI